MANAITIASGTVQVQVELNNTATARALLAILPVKTTVNIWGEEIYFDVPLDMEIEGGTEVVRVGDMAYWPDGPSLCLFFGRTPASRGNEIRAASPVTVLGRIVGDPKVLKSARPGAEVTVQKTT